MSNANFGLPLTELMIMVKPLNSDIAFTPNSMRGGNTFLLESVPVESKNSSPVQTRNRGANGTRYEALMADSTQQPARRDVVSKSRKSNNRSNATRVKTSNPIQKSNKVRTVASRNSNTVVAQQNRSSSNTVNGNNSSNSTKTTQVAQNPSTAGSSQTNTNPNTSTNTNADAKPIAPSASSIAKERSAMNTSLNTALQEVMGKEGFVAATDHRGYTAMIAKAIKKIKNPAQLEAFKTKIEDAGKTLKLNFGVCRTVNGKQEALNSKTTGPMSILHQGEYKKIEAEFRSKPNTPNKTTVTPGEQNNQPANGPQRTNVTPAQTPVPTPTPTPARTPAQTTSPQQLPVNQTDTNNSIFPNPELIA
jgi:hypothetical protein